MSANVVSLRNEIENIKRKNYRVKNGRTSTRAVGLLESL